MLSKHLTCGAVEIPIAFITGISYSITARTITRRGGYITPIGYEPCEINVKVAYDYGVFSAFDDSTDTFDLLNTIVPDRNTTGEVVRLAGYPICPEFLFAVTNVNRSESIEDTVSSAFELDITFSAVGVSKESNRLRAMELPPIQMMPELKLYTGDKSLDIQDKYSITGFVTTSRLLSLSLSIGDDLDTVSQKGFLDSLTDEKSFVQVELYYGKTRFYIVEANLVEDTLEITGSVYPPGASKSIVKTYQQQTLGAVIKDLCAIGGIDCDIKSLDIDGQIIEYYAAIGTPLSCLDDICLWSGVCRCVRGNKTTFTSTPTKVAPKEIISYSEIVENTKQDRAGSVYWMDGNATARVGAEDQTASTLIAGYTVSEAHAMAESYYKKFVFDQRVCVVELPFNEAYAPWSVIAVEAGGVVNEGVCVDVEIDWMTYRQKITVGVCYDRLV